MTYTWTVILQGTGKNEDDAWIDAVYAFSEDPGATPKPDTTEEDV